MTAFTHETTTNSSNRSMPPAPEIRPESDVERLIGLGFAVFPCNADKTPRVRWQEDPPTGGWTFRPGDLIGVRLPEGTMVLDIDDQELFQANRPMCPPTVRSDTRRPGGYHLFYRLKDEAPQVTMGAQFGYDTRIGGKGYVIAWHPEDWRPVEEWSYAPEWVYADPGPSPRPDNRPEIEVVPPGTRDGWLASMAGAMRARGVGYEGILAGLRALKDLVPSKTDADFIRVARSYSNYEPGSIGIEEEAEETREVIHQESNEWPKPPANAAYHGVAGDIVRAIAPFTEADPVGLLGTLLATYGAIAGPGRTFHQGSQQHSNIFVSLVGETSVGRKGTAYNAICEVLNYLDTSWQDIRMTGLGSGEGLITFLKDREDPRVLIYEGEFGALLTAMTREGSTLSAVVRNAFDGIPIGRFVASNKQSGMVSEHHVGILANITNVELAQKLKSEEAANGFANRFLWLAVQRPHKRPFTESLGPRAEPFMDRLERAIDFAKQNETMVFTPEAKAVWSHMYLSRTPRSGLTGAITGRADAYIARLSMLYAMLDATRMIGPEHIEAASALWDYAERSAVYIFGDSTGNRKADAVLAELRINGPQGWYEIQRAIGIYRAEEMNETVAFLQRLGQVRVVTITRRAGVGTGKGSGGRPRRELELVF